MATTLDSYFPFDAGNGANITEDEWRLMAAHFAQTGVLLGVDNELSTTGDGTGMNVKVATGACWINGHYGRNTSIKTLTISAADPTNPRIDLVVARVNYTTNLVEFDVITGTPAGSPIAPSETVNSSMYEIALAQVSVPASDTSIAADQVTDRRTWSTTNNRLYRKTTLTAAADSITVSNLPVKKFLTVKFFTLATGGTNSVRLTFNGDTGNNYTHRYSPAGAADITATSTNQIILDSGAGAWNFYGVIEIVNVASSEKAVLARSNPLNATGATNIPARLEVAAKWVNTSNPISSITLTNTGAGDFAIGTQMTVEGHD